MRGKAGNHSLLADHVRIVADPQDLMQVLVDELLCAGMMQEAEGGAAFPAASERKQGSAGRNNIRNNPGISRFCE